MKSHEEIWNAGFSVDSPEAESLRKYFQSRKLESRGANGIRLHPGLDYYNDDNQKLGSFPCILFSITNTSEQQTAIQRVYITLDGRKAPVPEPKKTLGTISGGAIRFDDATESLMVAEGPETAMAVRVATGSPTWSAINAGVMRTLIIPSCVKYLHIWADKDLSGTGIVAAQELARHFASTSKAKVFVHLPDEDIPEEQKSVDWNDVLVKSGTDQILKKLNGDQDEFILQDFALSKIRQLSKNSEQVEIEQAIGWFVEKVCEADHVRRQYMRNEAVRSLNRWCGRIGWASILDETLRSQGTGKEITVSSNEIPYEVQNNSIIHIKNTPHGPAKIKLCNFDARITKEIICDDGATQETVFELVGTTEKNEPLPSVSIKASEFQTMNWPLEKWGLRAFISPGYGINDHLRAAIHCLSENPERKTVYRHTGWIKVEGRWIFVSSGRAICAADQDIPDVQVDFHGRLSIFSLPTPPNGERLREVVHSSLSLLGIAPDEISLPLLAAMYRAPLAELVPIDFSLFLAGPTGVFKTATAAIFQSHFGHEFNGRNLPASWTSTDNALEKESFLAKDVPMVIDDYAPSGGRRDVDKLQRTAERVLRAQGNLAGRQRMFANGNLRPEYHPRGLIISTGEDLPPGHSLRARIIFVSISKGDVATVTLSEAQRLGSSGVYSEAMSAYVQWLAGRMDDLKASLPVKKQDLARNLATAAHMRTPDQIANLMLGFKCLLEFAIDFNCIDKTMHDDLWNRCEQVMKNLMSEQDEGQAEEDPVQRYVELVQAAVGRHAYLTDIYQNIPPNPAAWGWINQSDGVQSKWVPQGKHVGYIEQDDIYLDSNIAFEIVQQMAVTQGASFPISQTTLQKRLQERGHLASYEEPRTTKRIGVAGRRIRVLHFKQKTLFPISTSGPGGPSGPIDAEFEPAKEGSQEFGPAGPAGPAGPYIDGNENSPAEQIPCRPGQCVPKQCGACGGAAFYGETRVCSRCHPPSDNHADFFLCKYCGTELSVVSTQPY